MKKIILIFVLLVTYPFVFSQSLEKDSLDFNDVNLKVSNVGIMFLKMSWNQGYYKVPKGGDNSVIYGSAFWFGGIDQDSNVRVTADRYGQNNAFFPGPSSSTNEYNSTIYQDAYEKSIWKVSKSEIAFHINNFSEPWYQAPDGIADWPGNGLTQVGIAQNLAPFVDVNNDGIYNPNDGDYPCIRGDQAVYIILNDSRALTDPSTPPNSVLDMEYHIMLYQYGASDYIDQTTFIHLRAINRSSNTYTNFKSALFVDGDIGFAFDDYAGCDTNYNVGYTYNATNFDQGGSGAPGYGDNPPAMGAVCLNHKMEYFGYYQNGSPSSPITDPMSNQEYWNYMNGYWKDGTPWYYGGNGYPDTNNYTVAPTKYMYPGNPLTQTGWSERNIDSNGLQNPDNEDRRMLLVSESQDIAPDQILEYDYAILFSDDGNHLEDALNIVDLAEQAKTYYDDNINQTPCNQGIASVEKYGKNNLLHVFPNPSVNEITIAWDEKNVSALQILNSQGQTMQQMNLNGKTQQVKLDVSNFTGGIYFVKIGGSIAKVLIY
jgi:hypothetical protein